MPRSSIPMTVGPIGKLILPALLRLLGRWAWYLPEPLGRLLPDVRFGHA
jgi:hypothetical protein